MVFLDQQNIIPSLGLVEHPLRLGLSMKAEVNLHDQKGTVLPADVAKGTVYGTEVYTKQLHDADAMIHSIIQDNLPPSARAS